MRLALISDIHANLEALEATVESLRKSGVEQFICLGDIVGYGPNPNECVDLIRSLECPTVMGNHDYVAVGKGDISYFNVSAKSAILWTREQLSKENLEFLSSLPFTHKQDNLIAVHSTPVNPEQWNYILTMDAALNSMSQFEEQICFIGHSHAPFFLSVDPSGEGRLVRESPLQMKKENRYLVNVGSVDSPAIIIRKARV